MAGANTGVYGFDSVARGHHVYETAYETLQAVREDTNKHNEYAEAITKRGSFIGHIPREILKISSFTINCY